MSLNGQALGVKMLCILGLVLVTAGASAQGAGAPVHICADAAGFPPYSYESAKKDGIALGATVDIVAALLDRAGLSHEISFLPWIRCLNEVETGQRYSIVLDATYSAERAQKYLLSKPIYAIHSGLYYSKARMPQPPVIKTVADMNRYRYCGIHGYNYTMYKVNPEQIDASAKDELARFQMLRRGRCDMALADIEPLQGFVHLGLLDLSEFAMVPVPEFNAKDYFFLLTKNADGERLLTVVNSGLEAIRADGTLKAIFRRYGITP